MLARFPLLLLVALCVARCSAQPQITLNMFGDVACEAGNGSGTYASHMVTLNNGTYTSSCTAVNLTGVHSAIINCSAQYTSIVGYSDAACTTQVYSIPGLGSGNCTVLPDGRSSALVACSGSVVSSTGAKNEANGQADTVIALSAMVALIALVSVLYV